MNNIEKATDPAARSGRGLQKILDMTGSTADQVRARQEAAGAAADPSGQARVLTRLIEKT